MKVYLAGTEKAYMPQVADDSPILVSFASSSQVKLLADLKGRDVVLDSGAFSAWTQGLHIDLDEYIQQIQSTPWLTAAIALDVICAPADEQMRNLDLIEQANLSVPIWPVFHEGDDIELLAEYVRRGYQKICLAGTVSRGKPALLSWVWSVIDEYPPHGTLQYHGLAMTQQAALMVFQGVLDSVDSTTWLTFARNGLTRNTHLLNGRSDDFWRQVRANVPIETWRLIGRFAVEDMCRKPLCERARQPEQGSLLDLLAEV